MMNAALKKSIFALITTLLFFAALEFAAGLAFVRPGACDFIERRILEQGLTKKASPDEFRVFFYGESTIQGDALYPRSTIDRWVQLYLKDAAAPGSRRVSVYNFGRLGCNSDFILQALRETLPYDPDMAVFYSAHNDFVQLDNRHGAMDKKPFRWDDRDSWREAAREWVKRSALLSEVNRAYIRSKIWRHKRRDALKKEATPSYVIEAWEKTYHPTNDRLDPDSPEARRIFERWQANVRSMISTAAAQGMEIVFFSSVSNLKEYTPNESVHDPALTEAGLAEWRAVWDEAEEARAALDWTRAATAYAKALESDGEYALGHHRLAQALEQLGETDRAREHYRLANDKDRVPLRAPSSVEAFYRRLEGEGLHVIPTQRIFDEHSEGGITSRELMLDTMHPSWRGQALMAKQIVRVLSSPKMQAKGIRVDLSRLRSPEEIYPELGIDEDFEFWLYLDKASYIGRFYEKSAEYAERALSLRPDSILAKRSVAWAYWRKGDHDRALDIYQELEDHQDPALQEVFVRNPEIQRMLQRRRGHVRPMDAARPVLL